MRQAEIDAKRQTKANNFPFGELDKRRMDMESAQILHSGLGGNVGELLECVDELRPAIGIARVIHGIYSDIEIEGAERLGPCQGQR